MVEWYVDFFGRDPEEEAADVFRLGPGETAYVEILDEDVEMADTRRGKMPRIRVLHDGKVYVLWLNRRDLARPIALYQKKNRNLKGKHLKISCQPIGEDRVRYSVEVLD